MSSVWLFNWCCDGGGGGGVASFSEGEGVIVGTRTSAAAMENIILIDCGWLVLEGYSTLGVNECCLLQINRQSVTSGEREREEGREGCGK